MLTKAQKKRKKFILNRIDIGFKIIAVIFCGIIGFIYLNNVGEKGFIEYVDIMDASIKDAGKQDIENKDKKDEKQGNNVQTNNKSKDNSGLVQNNLNDNSFSIVQDTDFSEKHLSDGLVDLNTATKEELCKLNGIGEKRAQDIIDYREKVNGFTCIEEIMNVKGIKQGIFSKIKNNIKVEE